MDYVEAVIGISYFIGLGFLQYEKQYFLSMGGNLNSGASKSPLNFVAIKTKPYQIW
jgi:hypothetical protein